MRLQNQPERIFFDATYTLCSGKSSGIERVVRNLLSEMERLGAAGHNPTPTLVVSHGGAFYEVDDACRQVFAQTAALQANALHAMPAIYQRSTQAVCQAIPSRTLKKWLRPQPGHLGMFKVLHSLRETQAFKRISEKCTPIQPRPGDLLVLPDAYWVNRLRSTVWPAVREARAAGARVASVIYDLIPLTHPEFVGQKRQESFRLYLNAAINNSDALLAISRTVLRHLAEYIGRAESSLESEIPQLGSFELGAELRARSGGVRQQLQQLFGRPRTPYLMVATLDPRKNHAYVLDAFDRLWQAGSELEICFVGRVGSRCDDLIARMAQHPMLGRRLHLFDDLTDSELHHCYQRSRGVVFSSIVEGFGLPIVEALWHGKQTFVSDTEIHREVGRNDCRYFDLATPKSLVANIENWEKCLSEHPLHCPPIRKPTSWGESTEQFLQQCFKLYSGKSLGSAPLPDVHSRLEVAQ